MSIINIKSSFNGLTITEEDCMSCGCGCGSSSGSGSEGGTGTGGGIIGGGGTGGQPAGSGPNGTSGSGPNGTPNPDGLDKQLVFPSCVAVGGSPPNFPFGSAGFELQDFDITTQIVAAAIANGMESTRKVISASLRIEGLAWLGVGFGSTPLVGNRHLSVTDSANEKHLVKYIENNTGIGRLVGVSSLRYDDQFPVSLVGGAGVKIDGQMPRPTAPNGGSVDQNDPAWLTVKVCSVITRPGGLSGETCEKLLPYSVDMPVGDIECWEGIAGEYTDSSTVNHKYIVGNASTTPQWSVARRQLYYNEALTGIEVKFKEGSSRPFNFRVDKWQASEIIDDTTLVYSQDNIVETGNGDNVTPTNTVTATFTSPLPAGQKFTVTMTGQFSQAFYVVDHFEVNPITT